MFLIFLNIFGKNIGLPVYDIFEYAEFTGEVYYFYCGSKIPVLGKVGLKNQACLFLCEIDN